MNSKGISRRGFLGALKGTAATAMVNPTIAIQQTLPEIAKASASLYSYPYRTQTLFSSMLLKIQFHHRVMSEEEGPYQEIIRGNIDFAREKKWSNIHDASSSLFYYDMACALNDQELIRLYAHEHATYTNGIENLSDCDELQAELNMLESMKSPDDIRHELKQHRDFHFTIFREGIKFKPSSSPLVHLKKMGASPSILLKASFLSLEDQLRLFTYVDNARCYIPLCRSLKGGLVSKIFEEMKETEAFNYLRRQALIYITAKENIIINTCPDFISDYMVGRPFTLREINNIYLELVKNKTRVMLRQDEIMPLEKIIKFYGADTISMPKDDLSISIETQDRAFLSDKNTYIFKILGDGINNSDLMPFNDGQSGYLNQLRHIIFEILGEQTLHDDVIISEVKDYSTAIRVTVPANTDISEFLDDWMAEQNPYDEFWDQEVPNEFLFDVGGYIKRHSSPAPKLTRAGLFGRKPEVL